MVNPKSLKNLKPLKKGADERRNMKGAPKKLPQLDVLLAEVLGKETKGKTEMQLIIEAMIKQAKKGNVRAAEMISDRGYGKVKDVVEWKEDKSDKAVIILPGGQQIEI